MEHKNWGNPEQHLIRQQAKAGTPFEILTNEHSEKAVLEFMKNEKLMELLLAYSWPTDEKQCTDIAKRLDMEPEQVAAVSKYQRGIMAEKENTPLH